MLAKCRPLAIGLMISLNCIFSSITRLEGAKVEIGNVLVSRHDGGAAVAAAAVGVA